MSSGPLNSDEHATWLAVKRLSGHALAAVGRDIETATGLSGADFGILTRLDDLGSGSLSQAALLASLEWEKSRLSHQLTRMEARQLVKRTRADDRSVTVQLLPEGKQRVNMARPIHAEAVRKYILQHISDDEAGMLVTIVGRLEDV
ncbi:Transcriptional regulator, MarR family [Granulibacter bethesdensis]|uniref:Transcriptional regulator, MarR family n=1 Tax=Granulibacter bethesdensis TaxID=364410 RepID=A0AAC9P920_9PROT|nr:MarR family transcriptional regulator [Granulibacter bethesdensis]APH55098.1 Transcriptional regulator, MarR family [Granulibacter bethesdensis]APH62684.1 Transcriptional regulator, MarR family [Granulibacter bethesdensis]